MYWNSHLSTCLHYYHINVLDEQKSSFLPADVVGLAGGLQFETIGFLLFFIRADRDDGLTPALRACRLIADRAGAEQHAIAVLGRNL